MRKEDYRDTPHLINGSRSILIKITITIIIKKCVGEGLEVVINLE